MRDAVRTQPDLLHTHDLSDDQWDQRTAMHCAARYAHLDMIKFFVEQGAEVYSNPMNRYPPVFVADCYRHHPDRPNAQHVVDYLLLEIPEKADGTQRLGAKPRKLAAISSSISCGLSKRIAATCSTGML